MALPLYTSRPFGQPRVPVTWSDATHKLTTLVDERQPLQIGWGSEQRQCSGRSGVTMNDGTDCNQNGKGVILAGRYKGTTFKLQYDPGPSMAAAGYSASSVNYQVGGTPTPRKVWLVQAPGESDLRVYTAPEQSGETFPTFNGAMGGYAGGLAIRPDGVMALVQYAGDYVLRTVTQDGVTTTVSTPGFTNPSGIAFAGVNYLVSDDPFRPTLYLVNMLGTATFLAGGNSPDVVDGLGAAASLVGPLLLSRLSDSEWIFADGTTIRKVDLTGAVTTITGAPYTFAFTDGTLANARFYWPVGVTVAPNGHIYVADATTIREITLGSPGSVTTLAGVGGDSAIVDGVGSAARFKSVSGITCDADGNLYVIDGITSGYASPGRMVRKITPAGVVTTIVGDAGDTNAWNWSIDGSGGDALMAYPIAIVCDSDGILWVRDFEAIRRVTRGGLVTTVAGGIVGPEIVDIMGTWSAFSLGGFDDSVIPPPPASRGGAYLGFWGSLTTAAPPTCAAPHNWGGEYGYGQAHQWVPDTDGTRWKLWTDGVRRGKALQMTLVAGEGGDYWDVAGAALLDCPENSELCAITML